MKRLGIGSVLIAAIVVFLLAAHACTSQSVPAAATPKPEPAVPVRVGVASVRTVPVEIRAIGNVQPYSTVSIKSQVGGELTRVYFKDGQDVRAGDLLFTIDPRPYVAALRQAQANLARDNAQAVNAETDVLRYQDLYKSGLVPQQQYDQARATAEALRATLDADRAAIETARLQLSYTNIRSPIDGRTGSVLVNQGNLIKANDVPMVTINQIRPIYVSFAVPGQYLPEIKRYSAQHPLRVEAFPKQGGRIETGALTFVDNTIDLTTGTIQLKGTFANQDRALWPGEFVDAVLTLATRPNTVVVPSQAVQTGQNGQYVFVVGPGLKAEAKPVTVGSTIGGQTVIESGVAPGETVVTDGQLRLVPGAKVSIVGGGA